MSGVGLEDMRRQAVDLGAVRDRVTGLEAWTRKFASPTTGSTGTFLVNDGDGTASWRSAPGTLLSEQVLAAASAGAGDKLSLTITDPVGDVYVVWSSVASTDGAAGTWVKNNVYDGAGATGTLYGSVWHTSYAPGALCPLSGRTQKIARWSGSKTLYLNLQNSAGTPTQYGTSSGAMTVMQAFLSS